MLNQKVNNIVLACENQDPYSLVNSTRRVLVDKLVDVINDKKLEFNNKLLIESKSF